MPDVTIITLIIACLLVVIAVIQPLAARLKVPPSVLLALVGVGIGFLAAFLLATPLTDAFNAVVEPLVGMPVTSAVFLYVFLPLLLFQAALTIEVRRMMEDVAPILLMAVVAVLVAAAVIGFGLHALFGVPLLACLLLGSIVATTDPAAVVAIFRDIGAPARLTRLVEGESLLNDAAAIALFTLLLGVIASGQPLDLGQGVLWFVVAFVGGVVLGIAGGRLVVAVLPLMGGHRAAEATLTLAAPYIIYIVGDQVLKVSGVVAVVVAGLTVSAFIRPNISPANWRHLVNVWEQVAFWAGSLVFIMAAVLVPRILTGLTLTDVLMVLALVVAALIARALVLFLLLPLLSAVRLAEKVSQPYKVTILWGGLRGAVTLALALAVTENPGLNPELKRFVAVTASGFVLFTLFVNGTTLRRVIALLGLDRLSPIDQALRNQVLVLALADVRDAVQEAAKRHEIAPTVSRSVVARYDTRIAELAGAGDIEQALLDRERLALGLIALAGRERELVLEHHEHGTLSMNVVERLLRHTERQMEATRADGRLGYVRASRRLLKFDRTFRTAHLLHRLTGIERPLNRRLAERFETLLVLRLVLTELRAYIITRLTPLLGRRIAELLQEILRGRLTATSKALDVLRLQYPDYADALERQFLRHLARREELNHYDGLRAEGLLGPEVHDSLRRTVATGKGGGDEEAPRLDLGLKTRDLIEQFPLFAGLPRASLDKVCRLMHPQFVVPGQAVVRKGERGRGVYFVSSGAVEVRLPGQAVRLGRGDFFGEMALLTGQRRMADIVALTYCHLLVLDNADFQKFLDVNPEIKTHIESTMAARAAANGKG